MKFDYYYQTEGTPEVKITLREAKEICKRFGKNTKNLSDPNIAEVMCSSSVRVWAEEAMNY